VGHYVDLKDGGRVWVGSSGEELKVLRDRLAKTRDALREIIALTTDGQVIATATQALLT
jgi:hypothetical protein